MMTPHVGAFIRDEILDELGLSVLKAAEVLGVRRATLSDLVNEKAFGVKMDLLLKMQAGYDIENMRQHGDFIGVLRYASPAL